MTIIGSCILLLVQIVAQDVALPAGVTDLLSKLVEFQDAQSHEVELKIEAAEKSALAILAKHQARETEDGNLETALALRKIRKLGIGKEDGQTIPADSKAVILKFQKYADEQRTALSESIAVKQRAVVKLLKQQVEEETKNGNTDAALAIQNRLKVLAAAIPETAQTMDGTIESRPKPFRDRSKVRGILAKLSAEPGIIQVVNTESVSLNSLAEEGKKIIAEGKKSKWGNPPSGLLELGAMVHVSTGSSKGVAAYKVLKEGYVIIACNYAYQGNSSGGWVETRWKAEDFRANGWKELGEKEMGGNLLSSKGGALDVFYKKLKEGEEGTLRCNKYGPPVFVTFPRKEG